MLTLAFDTSTPAVGVAVGDERGVLASLTVQEGRRHAETLIPAADALLRFLQRERRALTHVTVDVGPGLFTGLRVGVATAKGLALALGIEVAPVTSLELLAHAAAEHGVRGRLATVLDARRGELYGASWDLHGAWPVAVVPPFVSPIPDAVRRIGIDAATTVLGNGAVLVDERVGIRLASLRDPDARVAVRRLCTAAASGRLNEITQRGDDVELVYLRASDAELAKGAS